MSVPSSCLQRSEIRQRGATKQPTYREIREAFTAEHGSPREFNVI